MYSRSPRGIKYEYRHHLRAILPGFIHGRIWVWPFQKFTIYRMWNYRKDCEYTVDSAKGWEQ